MSDVAVEGSARAALPVVAVKLQKIKRPHEIIRGASWPNAESVGPLLLLRPKLAELQ